MRQPQGHSPRKRKPLLCSAPRSRCRCPTLIRLRHLLPSREKAKEPRTLTNWRPAWSRTVCVGLLPLWEKVPEGRMRGSPKLRVLASLRQERSHLPRPSVTTSSFSRSRGKVAAQPTEGGGQNHYASGSILPGFNIPSGSSASLTDRIIASATGSLIRPSNPRFSWPMPCSADTDPPSARTMS